MSWLLDQRKYTDRGTAVYEFHIEHRGAYNGSNSPQLKSVKSMIYRWCQETFGEESPELMMSMSFGKSALPHVPENARWLQVVPGIFRFARKDDIMLFKLTWANVDHLNALMQPN